MPYRPILLGIQQHIKERPFLIQKFCRLKTIKPQEPIRLIKPVFPQKRGASRQCRQILVLVHFYKSGIEHSLQFKFLIQTLGHIQDLIVRLRRGTDDHLGSLTAAHKLGRMTVYHQLLFVGMNASLDLPHRSQDIFPVLIGCQRFQSFRSGKLQIHAHPVHQKTQPLYQLRISTRNGLHMYITVEMIFVAQKPDGTVDQFHSKTGAFHNAGT